MTDGALVARLDAGLVRPVVYLGHMTGIARKPDDSALFRLLLRSTGRLDAAREADGAR